MEEAQSPSGLVKGHFTIREVSGYAKDPPRDAFLKERRLARIGQVDRVQLYQRSPPTTAPNGPLRSVSRMGVNAQVVALRGHPAPVLSFWGSSSLVDECTIPPRREITMVGCDSQRKTIASSYFRTPTASPEM
jgi:hypothetical protein